METDEIMGVIGLIALRKSELYYKIVSELSGDKPMSEKDKEKIKKYISEMNNERLLSKMEKEEKKIYPTLELKDIELDIKEIIKEIKIYESQRIS